MTTQDALYAIDDLLTMWLVGDTNADNTFLQILAVLEDTDLCN